MIAGFVGMLAAFIIVVLVMLYGKRKLDPTIAIPLNKYLTSQGFTLVDQADPILNAIKDICRLTMYATYVEQVYKRVSDNCVVCWLGNSAGTTNHLAAVIPKKNKSGTWVMLFIPGMKGMSGNFIRKSFELSLSSNFTKMAPGFLGQSGIQGDLYVKSGDPMPSFKDEFINLLPKCGNIILRSTGSTILLERISLNKTETWEQEARELLRITELLRAWS